MRPRATRHWNRRTVAAIALVLAAAWLGCQRDTGVDPAKKPKKKFSVVTPKDNLPEGPSEGKRNEPDKQGPKTPGPAPPLEMPKVLLNAQLQAASLVKVDDPMPEGELPDLEGKKHSIGSLLGEKLTVVLFWASENPYSAPALADLQPDVLAPYGKKGVRVIGISHKDSAEDARKAAQEAEAQYPILLDADGSYFAKVAKEKLPRIYVLDAKGRILWFDVEYSKSTRRDLMTAIKVVLGEK